MLEVRTRLQADVMKQRRLLYPNLAVTYAKCTLVGWNWGHLLPLSCKDRIILSTVIIGIKKLLEPLEELKVVLEFALHEFLHWNYLVKVGSGETQVYMCREKLVIWSKCLVNSPLS